MLTVPAPGSVDCWVVDWSMLHNDQLRSMADVLSAGEWDRSQGFRFAVDRRRFLASHTAVRLLISRYTHEPAETLPILPDSLGRPVLTGRLSTLRFNLSHAADLALVAFSTSAPVGVDAELVRDFPDIIDIASRYFSPAEAEAIRVLPADQRPLAFTTTWTRKEAVLKALGLGLTVPLDAFDTGRPGGAPSVSGSGPRWANWTLVDLRPTTGYVGAVAIQRSAVSIAMRRFAWLDGQHERAALD